MHGPAVLAAFRSDGALVAATGNAEWGSRSPLPGATACSAARTTWCAPIGFRRRAESVACVRRDGDERAQFYEAACPTHEEREDEDWHDCKDEIGPRPIAIVGRDIFSASTRRSKRTCARCSRRGNPDRSAPERRGGAAADRSRCGLAHPPRFRDAITSMSRSADAGTATSYAPNARPRRARARRGSRAAPPRRRGASRDRRSPGRCRGSRAGACRTRTGGRGGEASSISPAGSAGTPSSSPGAGSPCSAWTSRRRTSRTRGRRRGPKALMSRLQPIPAPAFTLPSPSPSPSPSPRPSLSAARPRRPGRRSATRPPTRRSSPPPTRPAPRPPPARGRSPPPRRPPRPSPGPGRRRPSR